MAGPLPLPVPEHPLILNRVNGFCEQSGIYTSRNVLCTRSSCEEWRKRFPIPTESETPTMGAVSRARIRVLVADDDPFSRESLASLLDQEGFRTIPLEGGRQVLERVRASAGARHERRDWLQLLVIDYHMPDLTGVEVLRRLRQVVSFPPPTIMVSGEASEDLERAVREEGAFALVSKPVEPVRFRRMIWKIVEGLPWGVAPDPEARR